MDSTISSFSLRARRTANTKRRTSNKLYRLHRMSTLMAQRPDAPPHLAGTNTGPHMARTTGGSGRRHATDSRSHHQPATGQSHQGITSGHHRHLERPNMARTRTAVASYATAATTDPLRTSGTHPGRNGRRPGTANSRQRTTSTTSDPGNQARSPHPYVSAYDRGSQTSSRVGAYMQTYHRRTETVRLEIAFRWPVSPAHSRDRGNDAGNAPGRHPRNGQ